MSAAARKRDCFRKFQSGAEKRKKLKKKEEFNKTLHGSLDRFVSHSRDVAEQQQTDGESDGAKETADINANVISTYQDSDVCDFEPTTTLQLEGCIETEEDIQGQEQ